MGFNKCLCLTFFKKIYLGATANEKKKQCYETYPTTGPGSDYMAPGPQLPAPSLHVLLVIMSFLEN